MFSARKKYDFDEAVEALQRVFGIVGISPVVIYEDQGFDQMAKDVVSYMESKISWIQWFFQGLHTKSQEILSDHIDGSKCGNRRKRFWMLSQMHP